MKGLIVFLLLLACALCAIAQAPAPQPARTLQPGSRSAIGAMPPDTQFGGTGISLFATGSGALASLFFVWSPFGAAWRRRLGSRAEISALILALLLCAIMAVQGCSAGPSPPAGSANVLQTP